MSAHPAVTNGTRRVRRHGHGEVNLPLVRVTDNRAGARGDGPAIIEEDFFTCRVPAGWQFSFAAGMDLMLDKAGAAGDGTSANMGRTE